MCGGYKQQYLRDKVDMKVQWKNRIDDCNVNRHINVNGNTERDESYEEYIVKKEKENENENEINNDLNIMNDDLTELPSFTDLIKDISYSKNSFEKYSMPLNRITLDVNCLFCQMNACKKSNYYDYNNDSDDEMNNTIKNEINQKMKIIHGNTDEIIDKKKRKKKSSNEKPAPDLKNKDNSFLSKKGSLRISNLKVSKNYSMKDRSIMKVLIEKFDCCTVHRSIDYDHACVMIYICFYYLLVHFPMFT